MMSRQDWSRPATTTNMMVNTAPTRSGISGQVRAVGRTRTKITMPSVVPPGRVGSPAPATLATVYFTVLYRLFASEFCLEE